MSIKEDIIVEEGIWTDMAKSQNETFLHYVRFICLSFLIDLDFDKNYFTMIKYDSIYVQCAAPLFWRCNDLCVQVFACKSHACVGVISTIYPQYIYHR